MASKNYRYTKTGKKNPNYVKSTSSSAPATKEERRAAGRQRLWETEKAEREKKNSLDYKKQQSSQVGWQKSISNAPNKQEQEKQRQKNREQGRMRRWEDTQKDAYKYDSQFTEDYFNNSRYNSILQSDFDSLDFKSKAEHMDLVRKAQAGWNYRSQFEGVDDKVNPTTEDLYDLNSGANAVRDISWIKGANEEDIRWLISDMEKRIENVGKTNKSRYRDDTQAELDAIKDYAKKTYAGFANEEMNRIAGEMAKLNVKKKHASTPYDGELLSAANDALEWIQTGNEPIAVVESNDRLREAVGFDELAKRLGNDEMAFTDELRRNLETIAGAESAAQDKDIEAEQAYQPKYDALNKELQAAQGVRDNLLSGEQYAAYLAQNGFVEAGKAFSKNVPDYTAISQTESNRIGEFGETITERGYSPNDATLDQIVKNPQQVLDENARLETADADAGFKASLAMEMTREELDTYWGLRSLPDGEKRAAEYFAWLEKNRTGQRRAETAVEKARQLAEDNPFGASIASFGTNLVGAVGTASEALRVAFGMEPNSYSPALDHTRKTQAIRETVGAEIAEAWDWELPVVGNVGVLLYNTAMSLGDMGAALAIGGGFGGGAGSSAGKALTQMVMSSSAAANTFVDAIDRGIDPQKAVWQAIAAGMIEGVTEKYSLDALFKDVSPDTFKDVIKYIGKNALTEGSEEIAADVLNDAVDILINQDEAELWAQYNDYVNNGYTAGEAFERLLGETLSGYAQSGIAGALSGTAMSGGNVVIQGVEINNQYKSEGQRILDSGNAAAVIEAGIRSGVPKIQKLAQRLANKISENGLAQDAETAAEIQVLNDELTSAKAEYENAKKEQQVTQEDLASAPADMSPNYRKALELDEQQAAADLANAGTRLENAQKAQTEYEQNAAAKISEVFRGSAGTVGKLYRQVMKALDVNISAQSRADMVGAIQDRLKQLGEDVVEPVANTIAKLVRGEKTTKQERELLEGNTLRQGVLQEVTMSILRNGGAKYLSDDTRGKMDTMDALRGATTEKGVKLPDANKAGDTAGIRVQAMVEESVEADTEGTIQTRARMLGNEEAAQTMIDMAEGVTNTRAYASAFESAYDFGTAGVAEDVASTSQMTTALTPEQFKAAYQAGVKAAAQPMKVAKTGGKVTFAGDLGSRLNEMDGNQRTAINVLRKIASLGTVNIEFFQSEANEDGKYTAENGSYDPKTNTIRIDVNAGKNSKDSVAQFALMRVAGHELTHYIKAQNTAGYKALQDFVVKQLTADGTNTFDGLVATKMVQQPDLSYAAAVEEVVADGCEMMLRDSSAIQRLAQENKGLFRRVRNWLRSFVANVKRAFRGVEATSEEAKLITDMEGLQKVWDDALVQASRNVQAGMEAVAITPETQQAIENDQAVDTEIEVKKSIRIDNEYLAAYEAGDEARASELVREAAIAAGYSPLKLYHGTPSFGFTQIDPSKSDDGISFFASADKNVSKSYVGDVAGVRRIGRKNGTTLDQLTGADDKTILSMLHEYFSESYQMVSDVSKSMRQKLISRMNKVRKANADMFANENVASAYDDLIATIRRAGSASDLEELNLCKSAFRDAWRRLRNADFNAYEALDKIEAFEGFFDQYYELEEYFKGNLFKVESEGDVEYATRNQAIEMLIHMMRENKGIYELYGKTDNLLEIDGKGENWNKLDGGFLLGKTHATTRDFAKYAKEMGFDGVHFKNIYDLGGRTSYRGASDVYTFFNPSDVKSADPFTFDDDGNLIPPSKRFDSSRSDIRYSKRSEDSEAASIRDQIMNNRSKLNAMEAVVDTEAMLPAGTLRQDTLAWAMDILAESGYSVYREGMGTIVFDRKRINDALKYLKKPAERAALAALPEVLKDGIEIGEHNDHKDRGHGSTTIGAPVIINGIRGNMGVVVKHTTGNFYKAHRIFMPDGSDFEFVENKNTVRGRAGGLANNGPHAQLTSTVSENSIADAGKDVKKSVRSEQAGSAEFKRWFKGRKIVNEDGSPKVMYHGTPYGGFTVFKDWQYFTDNQQYADVYQNPSASSIRGRYNEATNPSTYAVYLSVKKPFDTRIPSVRKIWQNEFYGKWGDGTPLSERSLPDWTEGIDLVEFLEENEYDFDAIILDEGGTGGYGDEVKDRGISVVVRSSNQVKSATDNIGTFDPNNPDIRYSIRTDSLTDREILADAYESVASNDTERSFLKRYRDRIAELQAKQEQLRVINRDISERTARNRREGLDLKMDGELTRQKNRAKLLREQIDREDNAIIEAIKSKPLQDVLRRQKQRIEKMEAGKRREAIAKVRDRRNATEVRHKIKAVLDDFNRRLKNPTERSYIPANMVQLVIAAEEMIDTRSGREGEKAQQKLAAIQGMYDRYKSDATFAYVYDPIIADMLNSLSNVVGNKTIYQLNSTELQSVYDTLKSLKKQVTEAVKLKAGNYARSIIEAGREMIRETQSAAPLAKGKAGEFLNWQLTPDKFFARLAGFKKNSIWSKVAETFSKGTEKMLEIQREHYYHFKRFTESKEFDKLNDQKHLVDIGLKDEAGNTVMVTRGMMLSAYMHLLNEENARGFMYGGFSIPNLKAYYDGKVKESYGTGSANTRGTSAELADLAEQMRNPDLTEEQLAELEAKHDALIMQGQNRLKQMRNDIHNQLTQYEKDLIAAVQAWNNGQSQQYINEVTMDLYGIKKASVDNYYPIHRDTAFVNTDFASISKNMNLENWGSLKTRVPSQAPILLTDIAYEMDNSLNQMSRYVGYARAQRDFGKLYNVRMPGMQGSVKKVVSVKFGTGAGKLGVSGEQYIENYIGSITGSRQGQSGPLSLIRRNLVRSTMTVNLRVGFSQLSAIPKAAAEVGWDCMAKGFANGGFKAIFSKDAREDLAKQNVWFWQRYRGEGGQREFADAKGGNDIISKAWNKMDDITRGKVLNWCQNFDVMSTVSMWSMAKAWARKHTRFAEGSPEFIEAANQKYTDIIRNTQAMSTTTERSDLARTPGDVLNMFTMFKSEAFANFNLIYDAVAKLRKYSADMREGKNDVTRADVAAAKRQLAGAATSVIIGASLGNAVLKLLINALTHSMNNYRDDEDEVTLESTLMSIGKEVAGDTAGMVIFGGELYELLSAWVFKDRYYAPNDMALGEITEALETVTRVMTDDDKTIDDVISAGKKLTFNVTNMLGVPAENVKRYVQGASAWIEEIQDGTLGSWEGGVQRSNSVNYDRLFDAAVAGDDEKFERVMLELAENEVDESGALEGFRDQVKEAYESGELSEDAALKMLVSHGGKSKDEAFWTMDRWNYKGEENYSRYADLRTALKDSDASAAQAEIQKLTSHGVDEKTVTGELTSMYNSGEATTLMNLQLRSDNLYSSTLKLKTDGQKHKDDFDAFLTAVVNGSAVTGEINKLYQKGYTTSQLMSALNGAFGNGGGKKYRRMEYYNPSEAKILLDRILKAYEALGLSRNEEIEWINENWDKFEPETE